MNCRASALAAFKSDDGERVNQLKSMLSEMQGSSQWWHGTASGFAVGVGTTVLTQPLDVIKSRMQGAPRGEYASTLDCSRAMYQTEGLRGFSRGFVARLCKIATGQAVIFGLYEAVSDFVAKIV